MTLTLTIIKSPAGIQLDSKQRVFDIDGGVIGRGASNDWVLEDPERFLSSKHCQILHADDQYYLVDLSTNGTFINGSSEPVGRGNRVGLNAGDQIDVGEYRFKVSVALADTGFAASPFDLTDLAQTAAADELQTPGDVFVAPEAMYMSGDYNGALAEIAGDDLKVTDPLLALDKAAKPHTAAELKPASEAFHPYGTPEDSANLLQESAQWPELKTEAESLPEDWGQDISILARPKSPQAIPQGLSEQDSLIARRPEAGAAEFVRPRPARAAARESAPPPVTGREAQKRIPSARSAKPVATKQSPAKSATPLRPANQGDRLLNALGLNASSINGEKIEDIHATVGTMMRETLEGLMQTLRARSSIKNEFRMNVTTIQPVENNPIKFSVNVDEALETMFVRESRAYKQPVAAIEDSFNAIADHQVAMIAGIRQAFRALLAQFDPLAMEEEFKRAGKTSVVPGMSGAKFWAAYQDRYQGMVNNMERSFQELFGDEFVQAYEDQLRKLAEARQRSK